MSEQNKGGPAFPVPAPRADSGMTLRDYFAAAALPQVYAASVLEFARSRMKGEEYSERVAVAAYAVADAMLAERAK